MTAVGVLVEGDSDLPVVGRVLEQCGCRIDDDRRLIAGGKSGLDRRIAGLSRAADHVPWLVLRDCDHEEDGCPLRLRRRLLTAVVGDSLCLRIAVHSMESWLLADPEAFADFFSVSAARIPPAPEAEHNAKQRLVSLTAGSRSRAVREGMTPRTAGRVGPEYRALVTEFCRVWRPSVAAAAAPSLARALADIGRRVDSGRW